jgi:hypothetical protein
MKKSIRGALTTMLLLLSAASSFAATITFDDVVAPPLFQSTTPLTDHYSALGVTFSGPSAGLGGAILNLNGGWPVAPLSGNNFLAFNAATYGVFPETITFNNAVSAVSIYANDGASFTMKAYNANNVLVDTDSVSPELEWELLSVSGVGIKYVVLTETGSSVGLLDNLSFDTCTGQPVPEPSTIFLLGAGLAGIGLLRRRVRS